MGGFHLLEIHLNTVWGASGIFLVLVVVGVLCYLCHRGLLQACCSACCAACCGFADRARGHPGTKGAVSGESVGLGGGERIASVPVANVPAVHYYPEHLLTATAPPAGARGGSIYVYRAETLKGLGEIMEEHRRRQSRC